MRDDLTAFVLALLVACTAHAVEPISQELTLAPGEQRVLSAHDVRSYSEGIEGIVEVKLAKDASQFVVVGKRAGTTTLLFLMMDGSQQLYRIYVQDPNAAPARSLDPNRVEARHNVRLDFYFVQLDESYSHDLGTRWSQPLLGGQIAQSFDFTSGGGLGATTAIVQTSLLPELDLAQANGWAKVLRQAAVITASGSTADFSSGGEVNVPVASALSADVKAIEFGSMVKVSPRYDPDTGRIELNISAEVADLSASAAGGIPGRTTSGLNTLVNMELGQTLVLAGLSSESDSNTRGGIAGLSQIPIVGALFGTSSSRRQKTENVIFIVPSLVEATTREARERVMQALDAFDAFEGEPVRRQLIGPSPVGEVSP